MKFKLFFISLFFSLCVFGQRAIDGENFFNNKQFAKARTVYESLLKKKPSDALWNYRLARCCYELRDIEPAIKSFEISVAKYPLANLYLGELYFDNYRFEESVTAYQNFIATLKPEDVRLLDCQKKMALSEKGARLFTKIEDIAIIDSVVVNKSDFLRFYKFSSELGTLQQESIKLKSRRNVDLITYIPQREDRIYSSDTIHGQTDIFTSFKLLDEWSDPASISNVINTSANENYPFVLLDGVTVYFASDGENSLGGYDIFVTRYNPTTAAYLPSENVGFPFNSPFNDYMMVIDEVNKTGWFATDRHQSAGKVILYNFTANDPKLYVHSEDLQYLQRAAQLKTYRRAEAVTKISTEKVQSSEVNSENKIEFVVNDSLIYSSLDQFKSEQALKLWGEYVKLSNELKKNKHDLEQLRQQYAGAESDEARSTISKKVIDLEKTNPETEKLIAAKLIQIRNEEIKQLQKVN